MRLMNGMTGGFLPVVAVLTLLAGVASAQTPQTIVLDGVNDFLPGNLIDPDGGDTQFPNIDLGDFYLTNDAVNLYVGMAHDQGGWGSVQLGLAIDVDTAAGGDTDPWGRQLEWTLAPNKPDFIFYVNLDNNWQASYRWDAGSWTNLNQGPGSLNWQTGTAFRELAVMLGTLGVAPGSTLHVEAWVTQDGGTKGPLDAAAGDGDQLSTPGFTLWDTAVPIPMTAMHPYAVQAAADPNPPVVSSVEPTGFPVDSFFDVFFNEPVDQATAETAGNYALTGATVTGAVRDAGDPSIVHLTLGSSLAESASLYSLTVTGVKDLAGNTIVNDGSGNVACFMLKKVVFRGLFGPFLANQGVGPHAFSVEGDTPPLTFGTTCDTGIMADTGVDDIWEFETIFLVNGDCVGGTATADVEWKFNYNCTTYEPLASNRVHTLDLANGATDVIEVYWNDQDPSAFTAHDIDVEFFVDMNDSAYLPGDTVTLNGSVLPLTFDVPSLTAMVDDGTGNDATAGDGIFSGLVTFPAGAIKDVTYKFLLNDAYECATQGDRYLFLNDEMFDTVGGTLGPLTLPVVHYDFCNTLWRAVEVIFSIDFNNTGWESIGLGDVVGVNGTPNNAEPPTFDWSVPSLNTMADDGVYPDLAAGDKIYTVAVVFPDTSSQNIEYKFLVNDVYECSTQSNRTASLDPDNYDATGNPQVLAVDVFQRCNITDVPLAGRSLVTLQQNAPNPFNPMTEIRFSVAREGRGSLRIYNARGELVRTLLDGVIAAGEGSVIWNGRTDNGNQAGSGVYFYRLEVAGDSVSKRMVLLK
ncbi:MAG: FlgD immunoglobulin-like domain containing protein [bacterium]